MRKGGLGISFLAISCVLLAAGFRASAGVINLKVNDVSRLESEWPMVAGVPFPKGEIRDSSGIRIMSGKREVPSQVDVAATWRDGSIRWVLAGFTASPRGKYSVEYGRGVKRGEYPGELKVTRQADGGFMVDTGAAVYQFDKDKILPENGWLISGGQKIKIFEGSGSGVYLVDNSGRMARVAGQAAEIENEVLKEGPGRFVVKRSGWYVTDAGEKLARAEVYLYFASGTPHIKTTHTLVLTEDTNKVWFRDYGFEFKTAGKPADIYCAAGIPGQEDVRKITADGNEIYMLQDEYPHFAEREYKAEIGRSAGGNDTLMKDIKTAGDWAHGDYGNYGITVVMPWLAERYPKEISFGERGARAALWSGRSGKELDFRAKTLVDEYWQTWAKTAPGAPADPYSIPSNAAGTSLTHDVWLLLHDGTYSPEPVRKSAMAAARTTLVLSDPKWLCGTEALGWPSHYRDPEKFPEIEKLISDDWQRLLFPLKAFPMTGVISWGCFPDVSYTTVNGRLMSTFGDSRLKGIMDYGMRRAPFLLYARSGEREYYEYGYRFSRFTGDYGIAHWDVPGKERGADITGDRGGLPFFWQGKTVPYSMIDGEIRHWLNDYYLTGDERSLNLVKMIKEKTVKRTMAPRGIISVSRILLSLAVMDWNEHICEMSRDFIHSTIDLKSQNGVRGDGYGAEYKDERNTCDMMEYYLETGDELVKEAFLKLLDQKYRFERRDGAIGHRNYDAITYGVAYRITGEERYRTAVEQTLRDALYHDSKHPLSEQLAGMPENPLDWKALPERIWVGYQNPFIGFPAAMQLIEETGLSGKTTPLLVKPLKAPDAEILFVHKKGQETQLSVYIRTRAGKKTEIPKVFPYGEHAERNPITGVKAKIEKRMARGTWYDKQGYPPDSYEYYHSFVTIPAEIPGGLYLLSLGDDITFSVLDATANKIALYCPEGFWSVSVAEHGGTIYGRPGEGMPLFFRVPAKLKNLEILLANSACVKRADGSIAVKSSRENTGKLEIPVEGKGGIWSIEPDITNFHGTCPPSFFKLLNVEPIVAYGSPKLLPDGTTGRPADILFVLPAPHSQLEFAPGIQDKALRLPDGGTVKFSIGEKLPGGGYACFPGMTGTAEFWFRADRSTYEIPVLQSRSVDFMFLQGSHLNLRQKYWRRGSMNISSILQLELLPAKTDGVPAGFQEDYYFRAGEWTHVVFTWDIKEGKKGTEGDFSIFINGRKLSEKGVSYGLKPLTGQQKFEFSDKGTDVVLGPFEGSMDMLRLSDIVRYREDFLPPGTVPEMDKNTRALFLFDGNLRGTSAFSPGQVEAK